MFGISRIYIGRNILNSKIKADREYGDFIEWAGSGVFDLTYQNARPDDIKYLSEHVYHKRKKVFMHDEKETWQVLNPSIFNPAPFNDYFYINIAALVDMPWYVLAGVSPGQLTGSEIGMSDYYKTLMNLQDTVYTPHLENIYTELLRGQGRSFENYMVEWNPIYTDETNEATILKLRAEAAQILYNINSIDETEARLMAQNGIADKDGNSILRKELPFMETQRPVVEIEPVIEPTPEPPTKQEGWMTALEKMVYEQEKLRGQIELLEQDERIKDAEKKRKQL